MPVESNLDTASAVFVAHSLGYTLEGGNTFLINEEEFKALAVEAQLDFLISRGVELGLIRQAETAGPQIRHAMLQFQNLILRAQAYDYPGIRNQEFPLEMYPRIVAIRAARNIADNM